MDKLKATESIELALEALRDLEEAIRMGHTYTIDLKMQVLRGTLLDMLEMMRADHQD